MTNTLTGLIPTLYAGLNVVSRELVGFIPSVTRDSSFERAAVNQTVRVTVVPPGTLEDITPAVTPPSSGGQTMSTIDLTISRAKASPILWTGEEQLGLDNNGPGVNQIMADQFAESLRALTNAIEADLAALHVNASRAWGTAGTTPFASDLSDPANVRKILDDNGSPASGRALVIGTTAGAKLRTLAQLTKANESGSTDPLRTGELLNIHGMSIRESAQVLSPAAGTMASATTNNAGYAIGATVLTLATAGTGVVAAGDVVTFAGDTNKYVVKSATFAGGNPAAGDTITLQKPGLLVAMSAATKAITVVAAAARNMAFSRDALALAMRAPALPKDGDAAYDRIQLRDPISGLVFEVSAYKMYRQIRYEVAAAWGCGVPNPAHLALLLG